MYDICYFVFVGLATGAAEGSFHYKQTPTLMSPGRESMIMLDLEKCLRFLSCPMEVHFADIEYLICHIVTKKLKRRASQRAKSDCIKAALHCISSPTIVRPDRFHCVRSSNKHAQSRLRSRLHYYTQRECVHNEQQKSFTAVCNQLYCYYDLYVCSAAVQLWRLSLTSNRVKQTLTFVIGGPTKLSL